MEGDGLGGRQTILESADSDALDGDPSVCAGLSSEVDDGISPLSNLGLLRVPVLGRPAARWTCTRPSHLRAAGCGRLLMVDGVDGRI